MWKWGGISKLFWKFIHQGNYWYFAFFHSSNYIVKISCGAFTLNVAEVFAGSEFQLYWQRESFYTTVNLWSNYVDVTIWFFRKVGCKIGVYIVTKLYSRWMKGRGILKKVLLAVNLTLLARRAVYTTVNLWPSHNSPFFHKLPAAVSFVKKKVRVEYQNVKVKVLNVRVQNVKATVNLWPSHNSVFFYKLAATVYQKIKQK